MTAALHWLAFILWGVVGLAAGAALAAGASAAATWRRRRHPPTYLPPAGDETVWGPDTLTRQPWAPDLWLYTRPPAGDGAAGSEPSGAPGPRPPRPHTGGTMSAPLAAPQPVTLMPGWATTDDVGHMADSAYAASIPPRGWDLIGGYPGLPGEAAHVWSYDDYRRFGAGQRILPIIVPGLSGPDAAHEAIQLLRQIGCPPRVHPLGTMTALDMETRHDKTEVVHYQAVMNDAGYLVWDYGSLDTVFRDPEANGFWVADWVGQGAALGVLEHVGTRAVQYAADLPGANGGVYDAGLVKRWVLPYCWRPVP